MDSKNKTNSEFDEDCGCDDKSTVCCNIFNSTYGDMVTEGSKVLLDALAASDPPPPNFKDRIVELQGAFVEFKKRVESAFSQAQKRGCGEGCCVGISKGIDGAALGLWRFAVALGLNPLFTVDEVKLAIVGLLNELDTALTHILSLSGCRYKSPCDRDRRRFR